MTAPDVDKLIEWGQSWPISGDEVARLRRRISTDRRMTIAELIGLIDLASLADGADS